MSRVCCLLWIGCLGVACTVEDQPFLQEDAAADSAVTPEAGTGDGAGREQGQLDLGGPEDLGQTDHDQRDSSTQPDPDLPLANATCALARQLATPTYGNPVQVVGTTAGQANEYGTGIHCNTPLAMSGPQAYYQVSLEAGESYRISAENVAFDAARLYLFSSCGENQINTDCGSNGSTGQISGGPEANGLQFVFLPQATQTYYVAIDASGAGSGGSFTLTLEVFAPPVNTTCEGAYIQAFNAGTRLIEDNTAKGVNEYGNQISCGAGTSFLGPQRYYKGPLEAGTYHVSFRPLFNGYLYLYTGDGFGTICENPADLSFDCSVSGKGMHSPLVSAGQLFEFNIGVPVVTVFYFVVDSASPAEAGDFTLIVTPL